MATYRLQHIVIVGLSNTGDPDAQKIAFEIAEKWVRSNYKAYIFSNVMYEKYDMTNPGGRGGGGEYDNQIGFGWTNGIILELLYKYYDKLTAGHLSSENLKKGSTIGSFHQISPVLIPLMVSLAAGFVG